MTSLATLNKNQPSTPSTRITPLSHRRLAKQVNQQTTTFGCHQWPTTRTSHHQNRRGEILDSYRLKVAIWASLSIRTRHLVRSRGLLRSWLTLRVKNTSRLTTRLILFLRNTNIKRPCSIEKSSNKQAIQLWINQPIPSMKTTTPTRF